MNWLFQRSVNTFQNILSSEGIKIISSTVKLTSDVLTILLEFKPCLIFILIGLYLHKYRHANT